MKSVHRKRLFALSTRLIAGVVVTVTVGFFARSGAAPTGSPSPITSISKETISKLPDGTSLTQHMDYGLI